MMLNELNNKLRELKVFPNDDGFIKVQFDYSTNSYILLDNADELMAIITDRTISFKGCSNFLSMEQMNLINGFMQTKPENRLPSEQYIVPIASEENLVMCYVKKDGKYSLSNINVEDSNYTDCLFKRLELDKLYEWLYENKGFHYAKIADQATMKLKTFIREHGEQ